MVAPSQGVCDHPSIVEAGTPCFVIPPVAIHITGRVLGQEQQGREGGREKGREGERWDERGREGRREGGREGGRKVSFAYAGRLSTERCPGQFL